MATAISAPPAEPNICVNDGGGDAVFTGILNSALEQRCTRWAAHQRQRPQINEVAADIERDHHAGAERQRQRKIPAGIFHLAGGERNVVPGVGGKQRSHLRDRQHGERRDQNAPTHVMQGAEAGILPEVCPEIRGHRLRVPPKKNSEQDQSQQRRNFRRGEDVLDECARLHAENIDDREHHHYQDGDEVLRVQSHIHAAEHHRADRKLRHFPQVDDPMTGRDCRPENAEKLAEGHAHGGDRAGLDHKKQSPAVEKTPEWAERLAQIDVLPARPRHHGRQFAVAEARRQWSGSR